MLYTYKCKECKQEKEVQHKMTEDPEIICDKCKKPMARKIMLNAGVHFKGSGFTKKIL